MKKAVLFLCLFLYPGVASASLGDKLFYCLDYVHEMARDARLRYRIAKRWVRERTDPKTFSQPIKGEGIEEAPKTPGTYVKIILVPDISINHLYLQVGEDVYQGNVVWVRSSRQQKLGNNALRKEGHWEFDLNLDDKEIAGLKRFLESRNWLRRFTFWVRGSVSCSTSVCTALAKTTRLKFKWMPVSSPSLVSLYLRYLKSNGDPLIGDIRYVGTGPTTAAVKQAMSLETAFIPVGLLFSALVGMQAFESTAAYVSPKEPPAAAVSDELPGDGEEDEISVDLERVTPALSNQDSQTTRP